MDESTDSNLPNSEKTSIGVWVALAVVAGVVFAYLLVHSPEQSAGDEGRSHPAVGETLAGLSLQPLTGDGKPIDLADIEGNVALINFWGTWCPPCQAEFPHLAKLERSLRTETGFQFLSVSCGGGDPRDEVFDELHTETASFLEYMSSDLPTYIDPDAKSRMALITTAKMNGFSFPSTVLIDGDGIIHALWIGYRSGYEREMEAAVDELLGKDL